ncbi:hypothetical protein GCM10010425_59240 [Streptomyces spororaveus]|uniref:Uncharacterized protein n=1 Tax=Streptomyces spororaveus TaxID=284039 RepID=A0ABQ3T727_9ACTN|nr:hypothetical protein Sspor_17660 [Streptomyces spororaveus]
MDIRIPCCRVRAYLGQGIHLAEGLLLRPQAQAGGALVSPGVRYGGLPFAAVRLAGGTVAAEGGEADLD